MKKKIILVILLTLVQTFLISCGFLDNFKSRSDTVIPQSPEQEMVEREFQEDKVLTLPLLNVDTLNPLMTNSKSYFFFSKLMYESLFEFDDSLNVEPLLVDTYSFEEEGRVVRIRLKDGITWHNGKPLTAKDVDFTIQTIKAAGLDSQFAKMFQYSLGGFSPAELRMVLEVKVENDRNFTISFDRPFANNLEVLTFPILPAEEYGGNNPAGYRKALQQEGFKPVGTGPFKYLSSEKDFNVTLEAFSEYWDGMPEIETIKGLHFTDAADVLTAFDTRQVQMVYTDKLILDKYRKNYRVKVLDYISASYEFLGFHFDNPFMKEEIGRALRKIIRQSVDYDLIIQRIYLNRAVSAFYPVHPESWLYQEEERLSYDEEESKAMLKALGFTMNEEDNVLENPDGEQLVFRLLTNTDNPIRKMIAESLRDRLELIGIKIEIVDVEARDQKSEDPSKEDLMESLRTQKFDIVLAGWNLSPIVDLAFAFHSSQIPNGSNFIAYQDPEMDELLEKAYFDGRRTEKQANYWAIQNKLNEDIPYIGLLFRKAALLVDYRISGELEPTIFNPYKGLKKCIISE